MDIHIDDLERIVSAWEDAGRPIDPNTRLTEPLYIKTSSGEVNAGRTISYLSPDGRLGIGLDLDEDGRLLGIEFY